MCFICSRGSVVQNNFRAEFYAADATLSVFFAEPIENEISPQLTIGPVTRVSASTDQNINGLLWEWKFASTELTFGFPTSASDFGPNYASLGGVFQVAMNTFSPVNDEIKVAARIAFGYISGFSGLNITETSLPSQATFRLGSYDGTGTDRPYAFANAIWPNSIAMGDSFYARSPFVDSPVLGTYAWGVVLHEIGHNLGLRHGHEVGGPGNTAMASDRDSTEFSLMTFRSYVGADPNLNSVEHGSFAQSYMMYDIATMQYVYGADFTSNSGNTIYTFSVTTGETFIDGLSLGRPVINKIFRTIWDGNGNDTYDLSNYTIGLSIDLSPGGWSVFSGPQLARLGPNNFARGNVFNALQYEGDTRSLIENAIGGAGADTIRGNQAANRLMGQMGNDTLEGGRGADALDGGDGFDYATYINAATGLTLFMGGGTFNSGEANGDTHTSIEGLIGSQFSDIIGGDAGINELHGLNGNDFVYGRAGVDRLIGGDGNDVLAGGLDGDRLEGGGGIDVAFYRDATTSVSASLLSGGISGEAAGDSYLDVENIWGSDFGDVLAGDNNGGQVYGFLGNDNLSGLGGDDFFYGGDGADTLDGGAGVDNFFFLAWQDQTNQFGTLERAEGGDTFTDFTSGTDRIILSRFWFGFGNIDGPAAALTETHANFVTNGSVGTSRPSLIWNAGNRTLSFDADGTGGRAAVLLGTMQAGATLTLGDIWTA